MYILSEYGVYGNVGSYAGHIARANAPRMERSFIRGPYSTCIWPAYGKVVHTRAILHVHMARVWKGRSYMGHIARAHAPECHIYACHKTGHHV